MPGGNDSAELVMAPGGTIWVADVGTTAPAGPDDAPGAGWTELGYASEDGVTFRVGQTVEGIPAWQSLFEIRKFVTERNAQVEFALRQWNKDTLPLAFGGGTVTDEGGGDYKFAPPSADAAADERAMLVDWTDGTRNFRLVIPKVTLADQVETQLVRSAAADLPLTFDVVGSAVADAWYLLTDDAAAFS